MWFSLPLKIENQIVNVAMACREMHQVMATITWRGMLMPLQCCFQCKECIGFVFGASVFVATLLLVSSTFVLPLRRNCVQAQLNEHALLFSGAIFTSSNVTILYLPL